MNWYDHQQAPDEEEIKTQPTLWDYIVGIFIFFGFIMATIFFIILIFKSAIKIGGI